MYDIIGGGSIGDNFEQLTLGELKLQLKNFTPIRIVRFIGTEYSPSGTSSYRGAYDELAINYSEEPLRVSQLLTILEDAYSKTYTGYKGGQYKMKDGTLLWAAIDRSTTTKMAIVSVFLSEDGYVYLGTRLEK